MTGRAVVLRGDARALPLPDESVDLVVTSPPYYALRAYTDACNICRAAQADGLDPAASFVDYGKHVREQHHYEGQIGSEATPAAYIAALLDCTREWVRVLKPSGSLFVNLGDKYNSAASGQNGTGATTLDPARGPKIYRADRGESAAGMPHKSLLGLPWRYALGCVDQLGLILRAEIVWSKPNGLPESVTDRVRRSHEQWFHLTRNPRYYSAVDEIREPHTGNSHPAGKRAAVTSWESGNGLRHRTGRTDLEMFNPLGKLPGSVWDIASEPLRVPPHLGVDHFAAFPTEWPRRIIQGWSPPGICTVCGEGRRPVVAAEYDRQGRTTNGPQSIARRHESPGREVRAVRRTAITGHTCACPQPTAPTRPAVILDPFGGTGTVALVAAVLGRIGITVDYSADYTRLAQWRTTDPGERARAMRVAKPPAQSAGQTSLFDLGVAS